MALQLIHLRHIRNIQIPQAGRIDRQDVQRHIRRKHPAIAAIPPPPHSLIPKAWAHKLMRESVIDRRYWTPQVGPPALAPPPGQQRPAPAPQSSSFASNITSKMGDLSMGKDSTGASGTSKKDGEKKEKKSLFKMKW